MLGHIPIPLSPRDSIRPHELTYGQGTTCRGGYANEKGRRPTWTTTFFICTTISGRNQFPNLPSATKVKTQDSPLSLFQISKQKTNTLSQDIVELGGPALIFE